MKINYEGGGFSMMQMEESDYLFGMSKSMNSDGFAIIDKELWRYCKRTKTVWPTGWVHAGRTGIKEGLPPCAVDYEKIKNICRCFEGIHPARRHPPTRNPIPLAGGQHYSIGNLSRLMAHARATSTGVLPDTSKRP